MVSTTAFNAFVGSFVILMSLSYLAALGPHLLQRHHTSITRGPFWMKGVTGYVVCGISCAYLFVFIVIFCLPYTMPVSATSMNYSSAITGGVTALVTVLWWVWKRRAGTPHMVTMTPGSDPEEEVGMEIDAKAELDDYRTTVKK